MRRFLTFVFAFCLINLWAEAAGQSTVLTWTAGSKVFQFSMNMFYEFMKCACRDGTHSCLFYAGSNNKVSYVYTTTVTAGQMQQETYTNVYSCERSSTTFILCKRVISTSCVNGCWSYENTDDDSCALGQVGFAWTGSATFSQEDNDMTDGLSIIPSCSQPCTAQPTTGPTTTVPQQTTQGSTTTTTDSTTIAPPHTTTSSTTTRRTTTTTTTSSTEKYTTTIASSSTSSTTGGGGNAPQKDDSSDDTGVIVGVVIAVLVVTAALIVGGIFWWRRRKNAEKSDRSLGNNVTVVHTSAFGITNHAFARSEDQEGGTPDLLYAQVPADDPIGSRQNSTQYSNVQIKPMPNGKGPNHSYENVPRPVQPSSENNNHDNSNGVTPTPENPDGDQQLYFTNTDQSRSPRFVITPKTEAQSDGMEYEDVSRFSEPDPSSAINNSNNTNDNFYEIPIVPPNITNSASNPPNNLKSTNNPSAKPKSHNVYSEVDEIATSNFDDDIIPPQRTRFNVVPTSSTPEPANDVYELAQAIDTTDSLASTGKPQVAPKVARKPKGRKKKEDDKGNHVYFELESAASIRLDGPYSVEDKDEDDDDDEERYTENPYEDPDKQQSNDCPYSVI